MILNYGEVGVPMNINYYYYNIHFVLPLQKVVYPSCLTFIINIIIIHTGNNTENSCI